MTFPIFLCYTYWQNIFPFLDREGVRMSATKVVAIAVIWGGVAGLSYLFHSFGILNGEGVAGLVLVGFFMTGMALNS